MWTPYRDDPWALKDFPLPRRRILSDVFVWDFEDGIAAHKPVDGYDIILVSGAGAAEALRSDIGGTDRVMVMGEVAPEVHEALTMLGFEERRQWDFFSLEDEPEPVPDVKMERLKDTQEVRNVLMSSYPNADMRTSKGGRWWGLRVDGALAAAGANDTWRGAGIDGGVEWNSHLRSFVVHKNFRGEGLGTKLFNAMLFEEWRRNGWVQWGSWADSKSSQGLMASLDVEPTCRVTNFRREGTVSDSVGFPGSETI